MVIAPPTTAQIFDLSKVAYLNGKNSDQISQAATVQQPSHAEMVTVVTGFIDKLIQSGVEELKTVAADSSNAGAQQKDQENLDKYNKDKDSAIAPLVKGVAGDLAKNIYAVKQFLIEGGLAEQKDNQELTFKTKDSVNGSKIAEESAKELAHQALELVKERLSAHGIKVDTPQATQLQTEIIQKLKKPPEAKDETPKAETPPATGTVNTTTETTKSSETPADHEEISTAFTKFITEISNLTSVKTLLKQNNGLEVLSKLNQDLADLNLIVTDKTNLPAALEKAFTALDNKAHAENKTFIDNYVANPEKFTEEFSKLDDDRKLQIQMTLINIEGQAQQTKTINNIVSSIVGIKEGLGDDRLGDLLNKLQSINHETTSQNQENHLDTINTLLNEFNETLKTANQAGTGEEKIEERNKATEAFIEKLNTGLTNGSLSNADIELIQKYLDPKNTENQEQSQKSITEQVFKNSIKNLNISEEQLKNFGGLAIAAVVGLMVFCPNAIGNLVKSGTGLAAMAAQTLPMLFQAKAMMQMSKKGNTETGSSQAA
jgi:hypothetical protein